MAELISTEEDISEENFFKKFSNRIYNSLSKLSFTKQISLLVLVISIATISLITVNVNNTQNNQTVSQYAANNFKADGQTCFVNRNQCKPGSVCTHMQNQTRGFGICVQYASLNQACNISKYIRCQAGYYCVSDTGMNKPNSTCRAAGDLGTACNTNSDCNQAKNLSCVSNSSSTKICTKTPVVVTTWKACSTSKNCTNSEVCYGPVQWIKTPRVCVPNNLKYLCIGPHCYGEIDFATKRYNIAFTEDHVSILMKNANLKDGFLTRETWLAQYVSPNTYWIEAGYLKAGGPKDAPPRLWYGVMRPDKKTSKPKYYWHWGPFLDNNDFGQYLTVDIKQISPGNWKIAMDSKYKHYEGVSVFKTFAPVGINIGEELQGSQGVNADDVTYTNIVFATSDNNKLTYLSENLETNFPTYPTSGQWLQLPSQSKTGGIFQSVVKNVNYYSNTH